MTDLSEMLDAAPWQAEPTMELRIVCRPLVATEIVNGIGTPTIERREVLQQKWIAFKSKRTGLDAYEPTVYFDRKDEWRDVPVVDEDS